MAKEQIVGVMFLSTEDKARANGLPREITKEYLYKDTLGCTVGEIVVVEARDSVSLARITSIYVDTIINDERPMRNVVSKVESSYTRKQKELKAKIARFQALEATLREKCVEAGWYAISKALAQTNEAIATLFSEYDKLKTDLEDSYGA